MAVRALEQEEACGPWEVDVYCRKDVHVVIEVNFQYHYGYYSDYPNTE